MTHVAPIAEEAITDPELKALLAECEALGVPDPLFVRIIARSPVHAKPLLRALLFSHREGNVDHRLKEVIRVQLARFAGDKYFSALRSKKAQEAGLTEDLIAAGSGDYEDEPRFSEADKVALRYADQMYLDPAKIDKGFYDEMKKHYTEAQIMELGAFIAFHYGMQLFMRSIGARPLAAAA